ncbi:MAG: hypothetical protein IH588_12525 [Anaerolineales bacterium]|nr:hypothetical protein [Anaerolineales bacterium]
MNDREQAMLLYDLFFDQWGDNGLEARRKFEEKGLEVLPKLLMGTILYIKGLSELGKFPDPKINRLSGQLMFGYLRPINHIFSSWCSFNKMTPQQILAPLYMAISESAYSSLRAVAILAVGQIYILYPKNIDSINLKLTQFKSDSDPLVRESAIFVQIFQDVALGGIPDFSKARQVEETAKNIIQGILSEEWPFTPV